MCNRLPQLRGRLPANGSLAGFYLAVRYKKGRAPPTDVAAGEDDIRSVRHRKDIMKIAAARSALYLGFLALALQVPAALAQGKIEGKVVGTKLTRCNSALFKPS